MAALEELEEVQAELISLTGKGTMPSADQLIRFLRLVGVRMRMAVHCPEQVGQGVPAGHMLHTLCTPTRSVRAPARPAGA